MLRDERYRRRIVERLTGSGGNTSHYYEVDKRKTTHRACETRKEGTKTKDNQRADYNPLTAQKVAYISAKRSEATIDYSEDRHHQARLCARQIERTLNILDNCSIDLTIALVEEKCKPKHQNQFPFVVWSFHCRFSCFIM